MTLIMRLPANSQAYLKVIHDGVQDKHDVLQFTYNYIQAFPLPWAYYKLEEDGEDARIDSINGRNLIAAPRIYTFTQTFPLYYRVYLENVSTVWWSYHYKNLSGEYVSLSYGEQFSSGELSKVDHLTGGDIAILNNPNVSLDGAVYVKYKYDTQSYVWKVVSYQLNRPSNGNEYELWNEFRIEITMTASGGKYNFLAQGAGKGTEYSSNYYDAVDGVKDKCVHMYNTGRGDNPHLMWSVTEQDPLYMETPESQPWTIAFWFKGKVDRNYDDLIELFVFGDWFVISLYGAHLDGSALDIWIIFDLWNDEAMWDSEDDYPNGYPLEYTKWNFFCIYFDGSRLYFELNNSEVWHSHLLNVSPDPNDVRYWNEHFVYKGWVWMSQAWIDEWGIWDVALTPEQRTRLYESKRPPGI